jgi:hypothetical protein
MGFLVKRPDLAFVKKRDDRFLALDSLRIIEDKVVGYADSDAWDRGACKRLKLDFDNCLLLEDMPIASVNGESFGYIANINYNEQTGDVISIEASDSAAAKALLGIQDIPRALLIGYDSGVVLVSADAEQIALSGGLAAKAGAGVAIVGSKLQKSADKACAVVEDAITTGAIKVGRSIKTTTSKVKASATATTDKAAKAAGRSVGKAVNAHTTRQKQATAATANAIEQGARTIGNQLGKSKGMFAAFKDEYKKSSVRNISSADKKTDVRSTRKTSDAAARKTSGSAARNDSVKTTKKTTKKTTDATAKEASSASRKKTKE